MLYDLQNPLDVGKFKMRIEKLLAKPCVVELKERRARTLSQNSYLHVILAYFGATLGYDDEYVKSHYFKFLCNPDLFVREKSDPYLGKIKVLRSCRDLTKEETALAIDRFLHWAATNAGVYIPSPDDHYAVMQMEKEIEMNRNYM